MTIHATHRARLALAPNLEEVRVVGTRVREMSENLLGIKDSSQMELCVVEALTNIVKHGSKDDQGQPVTIKVEIEIEDGRVHVQIEDNGPGIPAENLDSTLSFNPLDLDSLPENGMGLFVIRQFVDDFSYESSGSINLLTLTRKANT